MSPPHTSQLLHACIIPEPPIPCNDARIHAEVQHPLWQLRRPHRRARCRSVGHLQQVDYKSSNPAPVRCLWTSTVIGLPTLAFARVQLEGPLPDTSS